MTPEVASHWLVTKLREERELAISAGGGWKRDEIVGAVKQKYEGSEEWLEMQAAIASRAIQDKMFRILQALARKDLGNQGNAANESEMAGVLQALEGLHLRASYIIAYDGEEQATELLTGDEMRQAVRLLDLRMADDLVSRNRLQSAADQLPLWVGERTLLEALAMTATAGA